MAYLVDVSRQNNRHNKNLKDIYVENLNDLFECVDFKKNRFSNIAVLYPYNPKDNIEKYDVFINKPQADYHGWEMRFGPEHNLINFWAHAHNLFCVWGYEIDARQLYKNRPAGEKIHLYYDEVEKSWITAEDIYEERESFDWASEPEILTKNQQQDYEKSMSIVGDEENL